MEIACPKCGTHNKDTSRFCAKCGTVLPRAEEQPQQSAAPEESGPTLELPWLQAVEDRAVKRTERLAEQQLSQDQDTVAAPPVEVPPTDAEPPLVEAASDVAGTPPDSQPAPAGEEQPQHDTDPNEPPPHWVLGILEPDASPVPGADQPYEPEELAHIMPWAHSEAGAEHEDKTAHSEDVTPGGLPPWLSGVTVQETLQAASTDAILDPADLGLDDIEPFVPPQVAEQAAAEEAAARPVQEKVPEWLKALNPARETEEQAAQVSSQTNLHQVPLQSPDIVVEPVARHTPVRPPRAGAVEALTALLLPAAGDVAGRVVPIHSTVGALAERDQRKRSPINWLLPDGIIYLAILAALLSVLLIKPPFGDVTAPSAPGAQEFYSAIRDSPSNKPVLVVYDWDATRSAEMSVLSEAVMRQLMSSHRRFVTISTNPQGPGFAEQITRNARQQYGYEYERDYLVLGYLPGNEAALNALVNNFNQSLPRDYVYNRNVNGSRLIGGGQLHSIGDFGLIITLPSEEAELRNWIEQVGTRTNVPIIAAVPQGLEPLARPYLQVQHAGVKAILSGITGALQYNHQLDLQYGAGGSPASATSGTLSLTDRLNAQSIAQLLLALVILAALVRIGTKKILRR